jgi:hypothetical protein
MTAGMIIGLILLPFAWMLLAAAGKAHREQTGVPMPSRGAMKNIRRNARKKGISEGEAYAQWLNRKQKRAGVMIAPSESHIIHAVTSPPANPFTVHSRAELGDIARPMPVQAPVLGTLPALANMHKVAKAFPKEKISARIRPAQHEPFNFDHLSQIASTYGWTLRKQAGGLYYLLDKNKTTIENPYADEASIKTDFNHRDLEDFLLTC